MADILVIDDEPHYRAALKRTLELEGHQVRTAADGEEGVVEYRNKPADLVIVDLYMPRKSGLQAIADLRIEFTGVKVIAITGSNLRPERLQAPGGCGSWRRVHSGWPPSHAARPFSCFLVGEAVLSRLRRFLSRCDGAAQQDRCVAKGLARPGSRPAQCCVAARWAATLFQLSLSFIPAARPHAAPHRWPGGIAARWWVAVPFAAMRKSTHIWVTALVGGITGARVVALRPNLVEALGVDVLVGLVIGTLAVMFLSRRRDRYRFGRS